MSKRKERAPLRPGGQTGAGDSSGRVAVLINRRPVHVVFTGILTVLSGVLGCIGALMLMEREAFKGLSAALRTFDVVGITVLGMLIGFLVSAWAFRKIVELVPRVEQMSTEDKIAGVFGVVLGLVAAVLLTPLVDKDSPVRLPLLGTIYFLALFFGVLIALSMKKELARMFAPSATDADDAEAALGSLRATPKLMDTNVVIDGRILEVWNSGFVEGDLLVPQFVLDELQQIADSADDLKRARGRRGLDLLNRMKEEVTSFRVLRPRDYGVPLNDAEGVDGKLVRLAGALDAALLTNDFNLSKVAELQGIPVLNVNRLALALKPVVMAGEEMTVNIIRHGRDPGQGVAYLDDGTMVVIEDGETKIGRVVDVVVSSMLQTVAGKMIFASLKEPYGTGQHR